MAKARIYPKADAKTQWWEGSFARGTFTSIEKILLHTTETTGWPGYSSGALAPTLTYNCKSRAWRQHNYLNTSARALADPSATVVRENRDNVIQIEIIAYADEAMAEKVGGLKSSALSDANLKDLAEFIVWVRREWGGPPLISTKFAPYPDSYGANAYRLSGPAFDAFKGILGHSNVPAGDTWGNRHGDPGKLNIDRIMSLAKSLETPPKPEVPVATPTVTSCLAFPEEIVRHTTVDIRASVSPAVAGKFNFQFFDATRKTWVTWKTVAASAGKGSAGSTPGFDTNYRAEFVPTDSTKYAKSVSAIAKLKVYDLSTMQAEIDALKAR